MTEAMAEITAGMPWRLCTPQVSCKRNFPVKNGYRIGVFYVVGETMANMKKKTKEENTDKRLENCLLS